MKRENEENAKKGNESKKNKLPIDEKPRGSQDISNERFRIRKQELSRNNATLNIKKESEMIKHTENRSPEHKDIEIAVKKNSSFAQIVPPVEGGESKIEELEIRSPHRVSQTPEIPGKNRAIVRDGSQKTIASTTVPYNQAVANKKIKVSLKKFEAQSDSEGIDIVVL